VAVSGQRRGRPRNRFRTLIAVVRSKGRAGARAAEEFTIPIRFSVVSGYALSDVPREFGDVMSTAGCFDNGRDVSRGRPAPRLRREAGRRVVGDAPDQRLIEERTVLAAARLPALSWAATVTR
jgi:hypothetical protein